MRNLVNKQHRKTWSKETGNLDKMNNELAKKKKMAVTHYLKITVALLNETG